MALELLIAVPDSSRFRFDGSLLAALAPRVWPEAEALLAQGQVADIIDRYVYLPTGDRRRCELAIHRGGDGIGITAPTQTLAADAVAWICVVSRPPVQDQVLLVNWTRELVPLGPDLTSADLLRLL
jgi:hypothetical protein